MNTITGVKVQTNRKKRVNVYLDGAFAFSLERDVALNAGLRPGQQLSPEDVNKLSGEDRHQKCFNAACRFLSYRPRSELEVRRRLQQQGHDAASIERAIDRLKELNLINDAEFARLWTENRETCSPRGPRLLRQELQQKGLPRDVIEQVLNDLDESDAAYRAAEKKARSLPTDDYHTFYKRLAAYLIRRGFGYEIITRTIKTVWKENEPRNIS